MTKITVESHIQTDQIDQTDASPQQLASEPTSTPGRDVTRLQMDINANAARTRFGLVEDLANTEGEEPIV